jgi:hypothetical protein
MFPVAKNDDISDAISQAAIWLQANSAEYGVLDYGKRVEEEIAAGERNKWGERIRSGVSRVAARFNPNVRGLESEKSGETRSEGNQNRPAPCPLCGGPRIWMSGAVPGVLIAHCNQDASDDGVLPPKPNDSKCVHVWRTISGGQEKCDHCGEQRSTDQQQAFGMSRGQYDRWRGVFGRFG